jgi:hypothetical protein
MPRRKRLLSPRHPAEAMERLERILRAMAPKVVPPDGAPARSVAKRGKRKPRG